VLVPPTPTATAPSTLLASPEHVSSRQSKLPPANNLLFHHPSDCARTISRPAVIERRVKWMFFFRDVCVRLGIRFRDSDNRLPGQAHPALHFTPSRLVFCRAVRAESRVRGRLLLLLRSWQSPLRFAEDLSFVKHNWRFGQRDE
jgi:hypothetical protein